ncbi:activator of mitotic machinery Cdc14 phosphatase activation C-term-domain-containing protein [Spinellus fusiger]|nr:activator of mitotic machinery Cdc14 phosphatase activation C-term-domain-containing protein [Spinellus fusiger]
MPNARALHVSPNMSTRETEVQAFPAPDSKNISSLPTTAPTAPTIRERKSSWSWAFWTEDKAKKKLAEGGKTEGVGHGEKSSILVERPARISSSAGLVNKNTVNTSPALAPSTPVITSSSSPAPSTPPKRFGLSSLFSKKPTPKTTELTKVSVPPKDFQLNKINHSRLPIHVERAVYRLSHSKLASPRRPLQEQVLISNLMFWYLSIISAQQQGIQTHHDQAAESAYEAEQALKARRILAASKKKKKHLVRKEQPQKPLPPQPPAKSSPRKEGATTLQSFMNGQSKESTGFVVPENYLRPQQRHSSSIGTGSERDSDSSSEEEEEEEKTHLGKSHLNKQNTHTKQKMSDKEDDMPLGLYRNP